MCLPLFIKIIGEIALRLTLNKNYGEKGRSKFLYFKKFPTGR